MASNVLSGYGTTIFEVMSSLAREHGALNLGQGFPDGNGPDDVRAVAARALDEHGNQYPPMMGIPELRGAVAENNRRFYDMPTTSDDVMVTSGGTEALACAIFATVNPGDEVVMFEPAYDSYRPVVELCGGIPVPVRLRPPDWGLPSDLERAFTNKTKAVILNSPMNPTGKVFSMDELDRIAELARARDAVVICDEVYEHLTFGVPHVPMISRPGMEERCIKIGSAGKTLSLTGWKVGYITAAPQLLGLVAKAHQFLVYATPPNLQYGVAYGLSKPNSSFDALREHARGGRDLLLAGLGRAGFKPATCEGTYFLNASYANLGFKGNDVDFCKMLIADVGVAAIPLSVFYGQPPDRQDTIRFCFCKDPATIEAAVQRLETHFGGA